MTTIESTRATSAPAANGSRILSVMKLLLANPWTTIVLPWIILAIIFLANLAVWAIIFSAVGDEDAQDVSEGLQWSGASVYIFVYMAVVAVQAITVTFPLALGYGATRRDFYLGSALTFVLLSAMYSVGLAILATIEEATNGWGFGGRMFTAAYFGDGGVVERLFIYFAAFLFFFFVGAAIATVYVRWKVNGMVVFFTTVGALVIGAAALITVTGSWPAVGGFFATAGFVGSYAGSLVVTAIAAVTGFFILRRATPKG